jgi:hypothetical protein
MENPIESGIEMADGILAMFGLLPKPHPVYSESIQRERDQMQSDIVKSQAALERFRTVDEPGRRKAVTRELITLAFAASVAVESGSPDLRLDRVMHHVNLFTQAFDGLQDIQGDIRLAEMEIADAQRTLDDPMCWAEGGAQ